MPPAFGRGCTKRSNEIRPLGVGINLLPHSVKALWALGLKDALEETAILTSSLRFHSKHGKPIWSEPRGYDAGYAWPQYSIHRGELQRVLLDAVRARLGPDAVHEGHTLSAFEQDAHGVTAHFIQRKSGAARPSQRGGMLIGADGSDVGRARRVLSGRRQPRVLGTDAVARCGGLGTGARRPVVRDDRSQRPQGGDLSDLRIRAARRPVADELGRRATVCRDRCRRIAPTGTVAAIPTTSRRPSPIGASTGSTCRRCSPPPSTSSNFRWSIAIRCRAGRSAASRCSATRRTRCGRTDRTARRRASSTASHWPMRCATNRPSSGHCSDTSGNGSNRPRS